MALTPERMAELDAYYAAQKAQTAPAATLSPERMAELDKFFNAAPAPDVSMAESAIRGVGQGASFGFGDEVMAGIGAGYAKAFGGDATDDSSLSQLYEEGLKNVRAENKAAEVANPKTFIAGDIAGSLLLPAGAIGSAKTMGQIAKVGAGAGMIQGAGRSESDTALGVVGDAAIGGIAGAVLSPAVAKGVDVVGRGIKSLGGKITDIIKPLPITLNSKIDIDLKLPKGTVTDDIRQALSGASDDVMKRFKEGIKDGLTPNQALIKVQAKDLDVPLSAGDITQSVTRQAEEDMALKGVYGEHAMAMAKSFRDDQQGKLRALASNVSQTLAPKEGAALVNQMDVGASIIKELKSTALTAKNQASNAYEVASKMKAQAPISELKNFATITRKNLIREGYDIDFMPSASKRLKEVGDFMKKAEKINVKGINLNTLENFRKRVINSPAATPAEYKALGIIRKTYDNYANDFIEKGLIQGDDAAIKQIKDARGLWSDYKQTIYGKDGKSIIGKIVDSDWTPETVMQQLIGAGKLGANKEAGNAVKQLKNVLGESSPEFKQLKQVGFTKLFGDDLQSLLDGDLTKAVSGGNFAKNVDNLLRDNKTLAETLYTKSELDLIKAAARVSAQATTRAEGAVNRSATTPALLRVVNQILAKIPVVGQYASGISSKAARPFINAQKEVELTQSFAGKINKGDLPPPAMQEINPFAKALASKLGGESGGQSSMRIGLPVRVPLSKME